MVIAEQLREAIGDEPEDPKKFLKDVAKETVRLMGGGWKVNSRTRFTAGIQGPRKNKIGFQIGGYPLTVRVYADQGAAGGVKIGTAPIDDAPKVAQVVADVIRKQIDSSGGQLYGLR